VTIDEGEQNKISSGFSPFWFWFTKKDFGNKVLEIVNFLGVFSRLETGRDCFSPWER